VALRTDDTYPAWLGWVALLSGLVGGVAGFIQAFAGFTVVGTLVLFTIASIAFTVWLLIVGAMLWGKTSRAAVAPAVGASPTS